MERLKTANKFVLYEDMDGKVYDVDLPLTSNVDPAKLRENLGVSDYVDLDYFPMKSAMVTLWASMNAPQLHEQYPSAFDKKVSDKAIPALLFGGAAIKIHCQSSNGKGPLARAIKDTDFIVPKKQGINFYKMLLGMGSAFGSMYTSFATSNDRRFNTWRYGERYRLTTINGVTAEGEPTITVLDLFCDRINLRHKVEIKDAGLFERYKENLYTVGLEALLLSHDIKENTDKEAINASYMAKLLAQDWGFWYTVTTNLQNIRKFVSELDKLGSEAKIPPEAISKQERNDINMKIDALAKRIETE